MSTRCQLRFIQQSDEQFAADTDVHQHTAQVYRHADGYPESVLADLRRLKQLLTATETYRGANYTAAAFVFVDKLGMLELYLNESIGTDPDIGDPVEICDQEVLEAFDQPLFLLGYGIEDPQAGIHGDEEYLYEVWVPEPEPFVGPDDWVVRVSDHCAFPRWDGQTEAAFDLASWQFEGTLVEAVEAGLLDRG